MSKSISLICWTANWLVSMLPLALAPEAVSLPSRYESQITNELVVRLNYVEGSKAIELANKIFGFNGWSSSIINFNEDFVEVD